MKKLALIFSVIYFLAGCKVENGDSRDNNGGTTLVFKYQDSVQCAPQSGTTLVEMKSELTAADIDVFCSTQAHDGNEVTTVCGADTGGINVYQIAETTLMNAENIGFQKVQLLKNANIVMECE